MREFTPKQIAKYKRQKYISVLNKCTTNLYKLFKNPDTTYSAYQKKFTTLKKELDIYNDIILSGDYLRKTKEYINNLYLSSVLNQISQKEFDELKNTQLANLNRLQKMKNQTKYSKAKHKNYPH